MKLLLEYINFNVTYYWEINNNDELIYNITKVYSNAIGDNLVESVTLFQPITLSVINDVIYNKNILLEIIPRTAAEIYLFYRNIGGVMVDIFLIGVLFLIPVMICEILLMDLVLDVILLIVISITLICYLIYTSSEGTMELNIAYKYLTENFTS